MKNDFNSSGLDAIEAQITTLDAKYKTLAAQAGAQSADLPKLEDALRIERGRRNEQRAHTLALRIELQSLAEASERAGFDEHDTLDELDMRFCEAQERHAALDDVVIDAERRVAQACEKLRSLERQADEVLFEKHLLRAATTTQRPKESK